MLLLIKILFLTNILPQVLNYEIQEIEVNFNETSPYNTEKHFTLCQSEFLYNQTKCSSSPRINSTEKTVKYLENKLYEVKSDDSHGKISNKLIKKLTSDYNIDNKGFAENSFEYNLRKRKETYRKSFPEEHPYAVSLIYFEEDYRFTGKGIKDSICSGSLLTVEWVLTASQCIFSEQGKIYVYAGGYSALEVFHYVRQHQPLPINAQLIISTTSVAENKGNDIGLIKLPAKFNITTSVNTIKLSSKPWNYHGYQTCILTGFGYVIHDQDTKDDLARKTLQLEVKQPCLCSFVLRLMISDKGLSKEFMCSKPRQGYGTCPGDSGGGLVCDGEVLAVSMLLFSFEDVEYCETNVNLFDDPIKCGGKDTLSVFQAVCPSLGFINEHVKLFTDNDMSDCMNRSGLYSASVRTLVPFSYTNIVTIIIITFLIL